VKTTNMWKTGADVQKRRAARKKMRVKRKRRKKNPSRRLGCRLHRAMRCAR
jgi:hypothetical protein